MSKATLLFVASEVFPFAKSGGLADVAHSLPRALSGEYEVNVVMPLYSFVDREKYNITTMDVALNVSLDGVNYKIELYGCESGGLDYLFIYNSLLCDREFLYGLPERGYNDNALRFGIFNHAVRELLTYKKYEIVHLNDWQSALVSLLIKEDKTIQTKSLFTIHNLAYQGVFDKEVLESIGISKEYFNVNGLEFYGKVNFMKAGIAYADIVTTVSQTYAKEILTPEFGCGLEGFLSYHSNKLNGIVNGIDSKHFSPSDDKALVKPYDSVRGKKLNKKAYLKEIGFKESKKPLFIFIGRFTWQKGLDLLIESLPEIASLQCNIAILGEGEARYHHTLKEIADVHNNIHLDFGYDESKSHRMYAASDFLLMPSVYEPCGLNQLIAMRYGSVPIVHGVGGLKDTVDKKRGIVFLHQSKSSFKKAIVQALKLYENSSRYKKIAQHNMRCDFSWDKSAKKYVKLYNKIREKI